jgi:DNA-directed RNA polymerase specialized sigma24 family protein
LNVHTNPDDGQTPRQRCGAIAERLAAAYRWQLLTTADLTELVLAEFHYDIAAHSTPEIEGTTSAVYIEAMYIACSGAEGAERQEQGYSELFASLSGIARKKYPDVADEAAQMALVATFEGFKDCRNPRAFLLFAQQRLWTSVRQLRRHESSAASLDRTLGDGSTTVGSLIADPGADPQALLLKREQAEATAHAFTHARAARPRAVEQFRAFELRHRYGLSDDEIAAHMGKTKSQVQVLVSRAATKLREVFQPPDSGEHGSHDDPLSTLHS